MDVLWYHWCNRTVVILSYFQLGGKKKEVKKETGLGLTNKKDENFGEWYSEVCFVLLIHDLCQWFYLFGWKGFRLKVLLMEQWMEIVCFPCFFKWKGFSNRAASKDLYLIVQGWGIIGLIWIQELFVWKDKLVKNCIIWQGLHLLSIL